MGILELFLLAVGLSMDAFAVAVCKGLAMKRADLRKCAIVGLWFGGFQALMPAIGYFLGASFARYIEKFDHWVAFGLLLLIGLNMIREAVFGGEETAEESLGFRTMLLMAIATSIDALAVGVTFAFLEVNVLVAVLFIGCVTFLLSCLGVRVGNLFGARWQKGAEIAGGTILVLLGLKILLEGLGILVL